MSGFEPPNALSNEETHGDLVDRAVGNDFESRQALFMSIQKQLITCKTFQDLSNVVKSVIPSLKAYPLPDFTPRCVSDVGVLDEFAMKFLNPDLIFIYPVSTIGDGNCVPRSLSLSIFSDQNYHIEVRVQIIIELVSNALDYLCIDREDLTFLCHHSVHLSVSPEETFHNEVLHVCQDASFMGMWQLMAAANVFAVNIVSVYPNLGPKRVNSFMNRTIRPRVSHSTNNTSTLCLHRSATKAHDEAMPREYRTSNHMVPLFPKEAIEIYCPE